MKTKALILALACGVIAATGAVLSQAAIMVLGLLGAVITLAWFGMSAAKDNRTGSHYDQLGPDQRILVRPIKKLLDELQAMSKAASNSTAKIIAEEAVMEGRTILTHCIKLVETRAEVKKGLYGRSQATTDLRELREKLDQAEGEAEKGALTSAIEAREKEAAHYLFMDSSIEKIDATLRQAEASLAEIRARLAVTASAPDGDAARQGELEETMTRLRSLSVSFDEAEDLLQGRTL